MIVRNLRMNFFTLTSSFLKNINRFGKTFLSSSVLHKGKIMKCQHLFALSHISIQPLGVENPQVTQDKTKFQNTVEPVLSGHPRAMANWLLNTGWPPNTGCKKYSSKNYLSSADQDRRLTSNRNIHFRHFNDLRK